MEENRQIMRALATAMNRIDQMYCDDVTRIGVKASELWLLYALDDGAPHSQKQICQEWGLPKTTLNTTLKQAEAKGYLTLVPIAGKRRERQICLTAARPTPARSSAPSTGRRMPPSRPPWTGTGRRWWPPWWRPWITSAGACGTALPNKWRKRRTTTTHENLSAIFEALPGALPADPVGHGPGRGGGAVPAHHRGRHDQHRRGRGGPGLYPAQGRADAGGGPGLRRGHPGGVLPVRPALRPDRAGHAQRPVRQVPDLLRQ